MEAILITTAGAALVAALLIGCYQHDAKRCHYVKRQRRTHREL